MTYFIFTYVIVNFTPGQLVVPKVALHVYVQVYIKKHVNFSLGKNPARIFESILET